MKKNKKCSYLMVTAALAGLCLASEARAASNLLDFEFNEGPGSLVTVSKAKDLAGFLGRPKDPANDPVSSADSPSQQSGDNAVAFNGVGFLVADDSTNSVLAFRTNEFTIETWVKLDPNNLPIFEGMVAYGGAYKFGIHNSQLVFTLFGIVDIESGVSVPAGEWHHVAAAWKPGVGVTFYLDGTPTDVAETNTIPVASNHLLNIGAERLNSPLAGSLDRVRIHKAFLGADQLDSNAGTPKAALPSTLVAYSFSEANWPFQSAVSPALPAISSEDYQATISRPSFSSDTPSGSNSDYSLQFTAGTYVLVPDTNNVIVLDAANPSFTAEAWVKYGALPAGQVRAVLFGYNGPGGAFSVSVTSDHKGFVTAYGILDIGSNASIPDDGGWHHLAVVHENGKEMRFYVDGILADTVPYTGGLLVGARTDTTMTIGVEPGLYNQYIGLLDRVRLTSGVLTPAQLDYLAVPGVNPAAPSLDIATVIELAWPTVPAGYKLQSTLNVNDPASWSFVTNAPFTSNGKYLLFVAPTTPKTFYRLIKP